MLFSVVMAAEGLFGLLGGCKGRERYVIVGLADGFEGLWDR